MEHYKNYENKSELMENIKKVHERMLTTLWVINKTEKSLDYAYKTENKDKINECLHDLVLFNTVYRNAKQVHEYLLNCLVNYKE